MEKWLSIFAMFFTATMQAQADESDHRSPRHPRWLFFSLEEIKVILTTEPRNFAQALREKLGEVEVLKKNY